MLLFDDVKCGNTWKSMVSTKISATLDESQERRKCKTTEFYEYSKTQDNLVDFKRLKKLLTRGGWNKDLLGGSICVDHAQPVMECDGQHVDI